MRDARALTVEVEGSTQKRQKFRFHGRTGRIITPSLPAPRPSIAVAAVPTAEEVADVDAVISKDGCGEAMAKALVETTARKAAGQAAKLWRRKQPELQVSTAAS